MIWNYRTQESKDREILIQENLLNLGKNVRVDGITATNCSLILSPPVSAMEALTRTSAAGILGCLSHQIPVQRWETVLKESKEDMVQTCHQTKNINKEVEILKNSYSGVRKSNN